MFLPHIKQYLYRLTSKAYFTEALFKTQAFSVEVRSHAWTMDSRQTIDLKTN
jgi:hypothetical protein